MSGYERHPNGFFNRRLFGRSRFSTCYQIATVDSRSAFKKHQRKIGDLWLPDSLAGRFRASALTAGEQSGR
jgi:hypothetical protein